MEKHQKSLATIQNITSWLDNRFTIPGTKIKFGIDALLSLIPGIGDTVSTGISLVLVAFIVRKGVGIKTTLKMLGNVVVDAIISAVPVIGTIFDIGFKSNVRNLQLLEKHLEENPESNYSFGVWIVLMVFILLIFALFIVFFWGIWTIIQSTLS